MSTSVSISIGTNTAIAAAKGFGWFVTGSPTLVVAGVSFAWGSYPAFDAAVAIAVGALLGAMALFLASINRRLLIDIADVDLDRAARRFPAEQRVSAEVSSVVVDDDHAVVFVRALPGSARPFDTSDSYALGEALKAHLLASVGKTVDEVYWKFPLASTQRFQPTTSGR